MEIGELRTQAAGLRLLGFNVHQARALVLLKEEWAARLANEWQAAGAGDAEPVREIAPTRKHNK